jgi:type IV pilus assembly protein PilA
LEEDPTVLNTLRNRLQGEEGFTLIELLVVILIIGILAAIAIPSFLNQKGKGEDSKAKADARTTQTALETWYTDNQTYVGGTANAGGTGTLQTIEKQVPTGSATTPPAQGTVYVGGQSGTDYTITVGSSGGRTFTIQKTGGLISRSCTIATAGDNAGGCKITSGTAGTW